MPSGQKQIIYQSTDFDFKEFNGLKLEYLKGEIFKDSLEPISMFLKVESKPWHQFYLDSGLGHWVNWNSEEIEEDEDHDLPDGGLTKWIDFTTEFHIAGKSISKIYCRKDLKNSKITIQLEDDTQIILKCTPPEKFDSKNELGFCKKYKE